MSMIDTLTRKVRTAGKVWREQGWRDVTRVAVRRLRDPLFRARVAHGRAFGPAVHPRDVQIEASSNCNLRCPSCSLSREVNPGRHLSPAELVSILDRLGFHPPSVSLNGIGEPLMNPHLLELVDLLAEREIACSFFTNGTLLTPRMREALLARQSVRYVGISCDGATKETFEALRCGAKFENWVEFVSAFVVGAKNRLPHPVQTSMSTVVSRRNLPELPEIVRLAARLGFGAVQFTDLVRNDPVAASMALTDAEWLAMDVEGLERQGSALGVRVSANFRRKKLPPAGKLRCTQPWEYIMVSAEGDILPCCAIVGSDKAEVMGNLFREDFEGIWRGQRFSSFRDTSLNGTNAVCKICPFY